MFVSQDLQQHLETSSSIKSQSLVIAEWNMNVAENIATIGNYRYRPTATSSSDDFVYSYIQNSFDANDCNNDVKYWCGATDADVVVDGGLDNDDQPIAFVQPNEKERLLYSLEDCFKRFRPRSGINKLRYFEDGYSSFSNIYSSQRPRYYMASRNDSFKYWTSYRKENSVERGIANKPVGSLYYIDDAAPFVAYKNSVPANRVVVKMQTNVGNVDLGTFSSNGTFFDDPFYGFENQTTPLTWTIQVLKNNVWVDAIAFNPLSVRDNGNPVVDYDGYVELAYGLIVPEQYRSTIYFAGRYNFASLLPVDPAINSAYIVQENDNELGLVYVWTGVGYESFTPEYGWYLKEEDDNSNLVTNFIDPEYFINSSNGEIKYKEFEYIDGLRVVVKTMNKQNSTFDLIELSPRLATNISDRVSLFNFDKSASDLGVSGMPVGQLLASNGLIDIFDFDDSFNKNNTNSILSSFTNDNLQIKLFENIYDFSGDSVKEYSVPLKTFYSDGFPNTESNSRRISISLRDMFFYLELNKSPEILLENATLSDAVSTVLDSIGFSNYVFKRVDDEDDPVIPYFFVEPDTSVAKVIEDLAIATQTAVFFDEENNLVFMSRNYIMPSETDRATDIELLGSLDQAKDGIVENSNTSNKLSNIIELASKSNDIFNDGKINYQEKYIAKTYGSLKEASYLNQDQNWIYKPALLWEVAGTPPLRSIDGNSDSTSSYSLAAIPLNSDLSDVLPYVQNHQLQNNVIDFGEGAYWVARYNGYLYANGEIIKYDAIEHNISGIGNVWISSLGEYQNYFSKIKFGGKIYPTGRVRIFAEPFYEEIDGITVMKNGDVNKNGRAQFGTEIAYHNAGLPEYWSNSSSTAPVQGIEMDSAYLFSGEDDRTLSGVYNQELVPIDVTIDIDDPSKINEIAYADSMWVAVGTDATFATSADGESWAFSVDESIDEDSVLNTVAYGDGLWVAAGYKPSGDTTEALIVSSSDGESWTEVDHGLTSTRINKVKYADSTWVVVGDDGLFATSSDAEIWTSDIPALDYNINTTKAEVITATSQETGIKVSRIVSGNPGVIVKKNHGLKENDQIEFTTTVSLPTGLSTSTTYYVKEKNKDSFYVKTNDEDAVVSIGSDGSGKHYYSKLAATFTAKKHGLKNNEAIRVVASGTLPTGLAEETTYYVRYINKDKFSLSSELGGTLIAYVSAQSSTSHKIQQRIGADLYAVEYGNNVWAIGGQNGVFSVSSDLSSWTPSQTKLKNTKILSILYENSQWLVAGDLGKAQRSSDLTTWSSVNSKLKKRVKTFTYGNGIWIAAGDDGKISRSTDLTKWKTVKNQFGNQTVNDVVWNGSYWVAVGNGSKISKSIDNGLTWTDNSQENIGELVFTTTVPHNLTPFDTVSLSLSDDFFANNSISVDLTIGTPAVFYRKNHKLNDNDQIMITATTGTLPAEFAEDTAYYVQKVNKNNFYLAIAPGGDPIAVSSWSGTNTVAYYFPEINIQTTYYVTPKNITPYSFTLADTRANAVSGITFKSSGAYSGENQVSLDVAPDLINVESISSSDGTLLVTADSPINEGTIQKIKPGFRVFFAIIDSNNNFTDKQLPGGLVRYAPFYVKEMVGTKSFTVSEEYSGTALSHNGNSITLDAGEKIKIILNLTEKIVDTNILSPKDISFKLGNLVEISKGDGELVSPTRVIATRYATQIKKDVTISIDSPAEITCTSHGLFDMDTITFVTTDTLPYGIDTNTEYFVQRIDEDSFTLLDSQLNPVETKEGENPDAEIPDADNEDSTEEVTINYRTQNGTHSFIKSFNDSNRVVISRSVGESIPQYEVSVEEVLVDEDGTTEEQNYYNNISYQNEIIAIEELQVTSDGKAGWSTTNKDLALTGTRNGIIKNYFTKSSFSETDVNKFLSTQTGTVQSSALVFNGPSFEFETGANARSPIDFVSYIHKPLDSKFSHFGSRMRIIGRLSEEDKKQIVDNAFSYFTNPESNLDEEFSIFGGSAGIGLMVNPKTNVGYYFEIIALSDSNVAEYSDNIGLFNVVFYKVVRKVPNEAEAEVGDDSKAIPIKLWQGVTNIVADDGTMVGQFRTVNDSNPSVYDISVEYSDIDENTRKFYLMINNKIVAVVDDTDPLPVYNNMCLFVRGSTRAMFENVYALSNNYSQNAVFELDAPVNSVFGSESINVSESFRKYALSGAIQSTYLSGIGTSDASKYKIYFEEFGTIMRECAYFNIKYDKAYPALYARISDTFNKMKGYTVSGFTPTAYGAEFLVFNNTDSALNLDETSGNYLRIQGVTFTQDSEKELTVDDYFDRVSNFADPDILEDGVIVSPIKAKQDFLNIKNSRLTYGKKEFTISSPYIQSQDEANNLMGWIISKIMKPRKSVGIKVFAMPTIQLGDIVSIDYQSNDSIEQISNNDSRFVVYNINYNRDNAGTSMTIYLSEVI